MLSFPFSVDPSIGLFGGVAMPLVVALALLGIDAIASELENPFGDDPNDLDFVAPIHELECEAMEILTLAGDGEGRGKFIWRRSPAFAAANACFPVSKYLVLEELAGQELVPATGELSER